MIRIIKAVFILFLFSYTSFPLLAQSTQPLIKRIILSQEEEFIALAYDFAVTKEEKFFLNDLQAQKIMLYDRSGHFIKSWKMRGQGPGEYQGMYRINFMEPYLGILDLPGRKLVLYRWNKSQKLEWIKNIQSQSQSFNNFQFYKNIVIFDGLVRDESGQHYLQSYDLQEKKQSLFLPAGVRFGQSPEEDILKPGDAYTKFSGLWGLIYGYLDVYDNHIYSVWNGMSEIIKIDIETKKWVVISHKSKNYKQPDNRRVNQEERRNGTWWQNVSWVKGVIADNNIIGLIYLTYDWKKSCYVPYLQTFNKNGVFQKENILEGASGDYQRGQFPLKYNRHTGRLYVLLTNEEDAIFEILSYQIRE